MKLLDRIKNDRYLQVLIGLVALGAVLRFAFITSQGLWYDEALTALSMKMPFMEMIADRLNGGHSPFYFILVYPLAKLFGATEFVIRLPSAIASTLSVWMFFLLAEKIFRDGKTAALSTLFFAISALSIYFAQEARMYAMVVLAAITSFYFLVRGVDEDNWKLWLGYILSTAAMFYLSASTIPIIFAQIAYAAHRKRKFADFFLSFSIIVLLYVPMAYFYLSMKKLGFIEWLPPINIHTFLNILYGFGFKPIPMPAGTGLYSLYIAAAEILSIALAGGLIIYGIASSIIKKEDTDAATVLSFWLFIPMILVIIYSFLKQPMFGPKRYVMMLSPAYYLLLGLGIRRIPRESLKNAVIAVVLAFFAAALLSFYLTPTREDWRGAINRIDENVTENDVVIGDASTSTMYNYYGKKSPILLDYRQLYAGMFADRWLLLRERDFNAVFGSGDNLRSGFEVEDIPGFWGLRLLRLSPK